MKKKLIAIVTSLAMVASLVPATAFAATAKTKAVEVDASVKLATLQQIETKISDNSGNGVDSIYTAYKSLLDDGYNDDLKSTASANGGLTLTGSLPYDEVAGYSGIAALNTGHYAAFSLKVNNPYDAQVATWAYLSNIELKENDSEPYTAKQLVVIDKDSPDKFNDAVVTLRNLDREKSPSFSVYYLTTAGASALTAGVYKTADQPNYDSETENLNKLMEDLAKSDNVVASKEINVNTSGLTLLSEQETDAAKDDKIAVQGFVDAVNGGTGSIKVANGNGAISEDDVVDTTYRQRTAAARAIYEALTASQKKLVDEADENSDEKKAYKDLQQAEKNVAALAGLNDVAALIKALPNAKDFDETNEDMANQLAATQKAVEALPAGAATALLTPPNYLTSDQVSNYKTLTNKMNDKNAQEVMNAIRALATLPKAFTDQASVDAIHTPLATVEKAYNKLSDEAKAMVYNYATLTKYRTDFDALLKKYIDPLYENAAAINLDEDLSEESIAWITELKTYVEGKYMKAPTDITDFEQDVYDALVAALDKVVKDGSSLENATIAAIPDQAYTGAAIEPAVTVTDQAGKEVPADDYTVIYSNNKDAGTATVTVAAKSGSAYTGSVSTTFNITRAALTDAMVKNIANVTYTGRAITPAISAASGVTYEVTYKNNTAVGKATAVITGTGNYSGEITKNFIVKPAKEAISSLKAGKKSLTVAYKAQTGAKYRIVYSPAKGQAKAVNTTATRKTIKGLKAGKTYKVKVRAYKTIDGTTYNGTYSTVKKVKVK